MKIWFPSCVIPIIHGAGNMFRLHWFRSIITPRNLNNFWGSMQSYTYTIREGRVR